MAARKRERKSEEQAGAAKAPPPARSLAERLFEPVDCASLVWFRVCFGLVMAWQSAKYLWSGWAESAYVKPAFHFTYYGFGWVKPWPGEGMYWHFYAMIALSLLVAAGALYRVGSALLFLAVTHWFLIEATQYNNHYYLECLLALLLAFMPAHRGFSVDAWLRPSLRERTVPAWTVWLLRFQIGVVYFYGGLAKFDPDWLTGIPVRGLLGKAAALPLLGEWSRAPWFGCFLAYGGLLLDLLIVPLLLWRRTRLAAFLLALGFHLSNSALFTIGVFPWFMIGATLIYFDPEWPRAALRRVLRRKAPDGEPPAHAVPRLGRLRRVGLGLLTLYLLIQVFLPFRRLLYPHRVTWSEEGFRFAWHMMLRHKLTQAEFVVLSPRNEPLPVKLERTLTKRQFGVMRSKPDLILQFAHHLAGEARRQGFEDVKVKALISCSLNGRKPQLLVDHTVDLAAEPTGLQPKHWIRPLEEPLPPDEPWVWIEHPEYKRAPDFEALEAGE
ncbi:MAG: HTTM domain-containing protein [Planctomycetota bacterium]|nr:HTTM domain-containing protein [Planctomycetota bacterium]